MRIERLAQENSRTQGPRRRDWYRRHSPEHLRASAALVAAALAARAPDESRAAIVLGAGACTEVPLEQLARASDALTLVDVDATGMSRARDELPQQLRARIQLVAADLTGGVSVALSEVLRAQPWHDLALLSGATGAAALDAAASCLECCPIPNPPELPSLLSGSHGLVISSLTLTQLFSLPLLDVLDTLLLHAPAAADRRDASPRYVAAAQGFRRRVALAHLALIESLLAPGGAAVLLTDVTGYLLPPQAGMHANEDAEALPILPHDVLDVETDLSARFALVGKPKRWRWLVGVPDATMPGRAYDVVGVVFQRR
ncbi:MAG: hypothetical protein OJF49_000539 [Ktedonobacterales bacterium]|jgi:hypothetical protein|nr:MAG: hypothetical protein OJF49_000539 [Ktedonobacterales bacterium]